MTAVEVSELLPLHQAELLKLSLVLNEDDQHNDVTSATRLNNGHMLHEFTEEDGQKRKALYRIN